MNHLFNIKKYKCIDINLYFLNFIDVYFQHLPKQGSDPRGVPKTPLYELCKYVPHKRYDIPAEITI